MVLPFLFRVHFRSATVQCRLTLVLLSMNSYETATTDTGLKNQSYVDARPASLQLVEFSLERLITSCQNGPATVTRLIKHEALGIYLCRAGLLLFVYIHY